jgi:hypothetical protein
MQKDKNKQMIHQKFLEIKGQLEIQELPVVLLPQISDLSTK